MKLLVQTFLLLCNFYFFRTIKILSLAFSILLSLWTSTCEALLLSEMELKTGQRIGIYIGTFDPIHNGHSSTIEQAIKQGKLDFLIAIPNNAAVHKPNASPFEDRLQMVKNIYEHSPQVIVPDDGSIGWPIAPAILEKINKQSDVAVSLVQIYGDDVVESAEIQKQERATYKGISEWIVIARSEDSINKVNEIQFSLEKSQPDLKIQVFKSTNPGQSSTKIKADLAVASLETPIEGLDPRVSAYIKQAGLYRKDKVNNCSSLYENLISK